MTKAKPDFKRMLLRLPHSRQDYATVALVAELARLLNLDLIATYVEDTNLRELAMLPDAREFRAGTWQRFSLEQLEQDLALTAQQAERLFAESTAQRGSAHSFCIAKGSVADFGETRDDDVIAVIEPKNAIERVTHQFKQLMTAALGSTSSVLLVPSRSRQLSGPIIVVADDTDDRCIQVALALAKSTKERMILVPQGLSSDASSFLLGRAKAAGVIASLADAVFHGPDLLSPASANGSLLIMARKRLIEQPALSQLPVLLVS